jgi:hypothetical protein
MATIKNGTKYTLSVNELEYMRIIGHGETATDIPDDVACKWECRSTTAALVREGLEISIPQEAREAYQAEQEGRAPKPVAAPAPKAESTPAPTPKPKVGPYDYANMTRDEVLAAMETAEHHQTTAALRRRLKAIDAAAQEG